MKPKELARVFEVPLVANPVAPPVVTYGSGLTSINFLTEDDRWGRITFEKLDSIKVSRGEYLPYQDAPVENQAFSWVVTILNSKWLRERYEYEKRHYETDYEFGGTVEEMLTDFTHYVFGFHDQFVEVLSAGIWFESADTPLGNAEPASDHPLEALSKSTISERFEAHGIVCQVRRNPLPIEELRRNAIYCSQTILEIRAELDGSASPHWNLSLRVSDGVPKCFLCSYFGNVEQQYDSIPSLGDIRPHIDAWLAEVHQCRKEMGKA